MKRNILAFAVAALSALPLASYAEGPTFYGKIDASLERIDVDGEGDSFGVNDNNSRIGLKGEEDLGALTGFYQAEFEINITDRESGEDGIFKTRNTFVGLKGDYGQVFVGTFDTPFKESQNKIDLYSDQQDMAQYIAGEERLRSQIGYRTPDMNGLVGFISFKPGEREEDNAGEIQDGIADSYSAMVAYQTDMFYLAAAYDGNVAWGFWEDTPFSLDDADEGQESYSDGIRLVGALTMDMWGAGLLLQQGEENDDPNPAEQVSAVLSGYFKVDQTKFELQYGQSAHEVETASAAASSDDVDIDFIGLGIEQQLSERTMVYAILASITTDRESSVEVGGLTAPTETDTKVAMVGAQHKF